MQWAQEGERRRLEMPWLAAACRALWVALENNWFLFIFYFFEMYTFNFFTVQLLGFIVAHDMALN